MEDVTDVSFQLIARGAGCYVRRYTGSLFPSEALIPVGPQITEKLVTLPQGDQLRSRFMVAIRM